ncbi:MAG: delta-60 repeat domain-containing protein, partial [Nitrospirota bacterium]|nr:delta-60 repeat domain-containing protein [Nitrospirota bacterium]
MLAITSGIGITQIGTGNSFAEAMVMQNNDMFLLAGSVDNGTNFDFVLARYNANGSLDTAFGNNGIVTTAIGTGHDFAKTIKIQTDGKILVAGTVFSAALPGQFALARYNANGSLDTGFGNNGIVITPLGGTQTPRAAHVFDLAIQTSDGKIIAGGFSSGVVNSR